MAERWVSPNQRRRLERIPEDKREELSAGIGSLAEFLAGLTPGVGDAMTARDAYDAASEGNYGNAALLATLAAIGLVPGAGDAASAAGKTVVKRMMPDEVPGNWYHGTDSSRDFDEARTPFFATQDPVFADKFALRDFSWGEKAKNPTRIHNTNTGKYTEVPAGASLSANERLMQTDPVAAAENAFNKVPNARVLPVRIRAQNAFDYENPEHVAALSRVLPYIGADSFADLLARANKGESNWATIERHLKKIRDLGFDGVYVKEYGRKNLAVFDPKQVKSRTAAPELPDITSPKMNKATGGPVEINDRNPAKRRRLL